MSTRKEVKMEHGLTFSRGVMKDPENGTDVLVDLLSCSCGGGTFRIYYPKGDDTAHLYCNNPSCRMVYCDHSKGENNG